ncbi:MAG TPA: hypothetical protein DCO79_13625, partial [Spirochaeta sp.]|nr:hypothetical protein [Spirochaeta sp.]
GNYLSGCFVYRACDGIIRDAAESNGVFRSSERRRRAVRLIVTAMAKLDPGPLHFYIDEPHPHSRDLAGELREALRAAGLSGEIKLVRSADRVLKNAGGILVSGDSEIIDAVRKVFDLASFVLETEFLADLPDLGVFPQP